MTPHTLGNLAASQGARRLAPYHLDPAQMREWIAGWDSYIASACAMPAYDSVTLFMRAGRK